MDIHVSKHHLLKEALLNSYANILFNSLAPTESPSLGNLFGEKLSGSISYAAVRLRQLKAGGGTGGNFPCAPPGHITLVTSNFMKMV